MSYITLPMKDRHLLIEPSIALYRVTILVCNKLSIRGRYGCYTGPESSVCCRPQLSPYTKCYDARYGIELSKAISS